MPRQLRGKGGITNVIPREKYGLGSKLKERFRKLIPNELADVAVKAAPFVAPFYPGAAALPKPKVAAPCFSASLILPL